ncbi:early nodulin-like protein 18 [Carex rostrata]
MATWRCVIGAATIAFFSLAITIPAVSAAAPPPAIKNKNYTVGEAAGWFFNVSSNAASANYSDWAASQTFILGDFLIFNTNTNSSVVQTNNETTYNLCDATSDDGNQTFLWGIDGGNSSIPTPQVIEIQLVYEGSNYFFSDTMEGEQCQKGMKFGINVMHGNGLPLAFNQTSPTPPPPMTTGGGGGPSQDQSSTKNGVEGMQGGMVWTCLVLLSLGLMAV